MREVAPRSVHPSLHLASHRLALIPTSSSIFVSSADLSLSLSFFAISRSYGALVTNLNCSTSKVNALILPAGRQRDIHRIRCAQHCSFDSAKLSLVRPAFLDLHLLLYFESLVGISALPCVRIVHSVYVILSCDGVLIYFDRITSQIKLLNLVSLLPWYNLCSLFVH